MPEQSDDPVHGGEIARHPFATGWEWETRRAQHFRCCTFCGSIHPEDLAAEGLRADIHWADMKYGWPHKAYADIPNRDPDRLFIISSYNHDRPPAPFGNTPWLPFDQCPDEAVEDWHRTHPPRWVQLGTRPKHHAKLYTTHLREPRLDAAVLDRVQQLLGVKFTWAGGKVRWCRYDCTEDHTA